MPDLIAEGFLQWTPQPKGRPRFARATGRAYTPAKTASAERTIAAWLQTIPMYGHYNKPLACALTVEVHRHMPIPASWSKVMKAAAGTGKVSPISRPDIDNLAKLVLDAANGVLWVDDSQIVSLTLTKSYKATPGTLIFIRSAT